MNKITPYIWYHEKDGDLASIIAYYEIIFGYDFEASEIVVLNSDQTDHTEMCDVTIFGQTYSFLCTSSLHHELNDAVSFVINCVNQVEIDKYWDYFTTEGQASKCGWCIDRYQLRWQIIPDNLNELMRKPNAYQVMLSQDKIIIADY